MIRRASAAFGAALVIALCTPVAAQPAYEFLRGTIVSIDGNTMVMTTREQETVTVGLGLILVVGYNVTVSHWLI